MAVATAMAAAPASMGSLSMRGSSFQKFDGLAAGSSVLPSVIPVSRNGTLRQPLKIDAQLGMAGKGTVRIRLVRFGRKKLPFYRIIIASSRCRRDGRHLEMVGHYNPIPAKDGQKDVQINGDRIKYWLSVGAQPSDTVRHLLYKEGILSPPTPPTSAQTT